MVSELRVATGKATLGIATSDLRFETGEAYRLGLSLTGPESASAEKILAGLERVGREKPRLRTPRQRSVAISAWRPRLRSRQPISTRRLTRSFDSAEPVRA
jgi:hypothetical protein